jgi:phage terminase large subunit-like protein
MDIYNIRGQEIKEWLMLYGKEVSHYVIFDDMDDILPEQEEHFVWTDPNEGITEWDATKAIAILSTEPNKGFVSIIRELQKEKKE